MRITSKSMVPSSKLSSAAASGMIQTGTAWWHSRSVLRASSLNFPTSLPVPLPIFRCSPSHPFKACCCFNPVLSSCARQASFSTYRALTFWPFSPMRATRSSSFSISNPPRPSSFWANCRWVHALSRFPGGSAASCGGSARLIASAQRGAFSLQVLQFQVFKLFACKRNQVIPNELDDPRSFGLLLPLERQTIEQRLPLEPDFGHFAFERAPALVHPLGGRFELGGISRHGLFGLGPHLLGSRRRQTFHLSIPALAQVVAQLLDFHQMEDRFKVLDLLELALIGLRFLSEPGPFRVEQRLQLLELFRRFQMQDDLLQDPDLVLHR